VNPSKGKVFLKDLKIGQYFKTTFCKGYLINTNIGSCSVRYESYLKNVNSTDIKLERTLISPHTEVIKLNEVKNVRKKIH
tara:strand:- start:2050 stop:2289 length:240 start_codon:yes stop_codon:yes gene_type:complete